MLACHFIDPDLKVEKGDNKIEGRTLILKWWFEAPAVH